MNIKNQKKDTFEEANFKKDNSENENLKMMILARKNLKKDNSEKEILKRGKLINDKYENTTNLKKEHLETDKREQEHF